MAGRTVFPSVTLPCHMSLFHSVCAERHGILTNTYVPQVRPVNGICETLRAAGKRSAFFYTWDPLKDLSRPLSLARANYYSCKLYTPAGADRLVTEDAERMLQQGDEPDFVFFYQSRVDEDGHKYGWMSDGYMEALNDSLSNVQRIAEKLPPEYLFILIADHGGHDRTHGSEAVEDMTIPLFLRHASIAPGVLDGTPSILDIAPTVTGWLGIEPDMDWEGRELL